MLTGRANPIWCKYTGKEQLREEQIAFRVPRDCQEMRLQMQRLQLSRRLTSTAIVLMILAVEKSFLLEGDD
jgi:hypothetical protein